MKTTLSKMLIIAATLLAGLFVPQTLSAQANPYPVTNTFPCPVRVTLDIYQGNMQGGTVPPCLLCRSNPGRIIPPGGTIVFPLGPCLPVCDIVVTVTAVGGVAIPPVSDALSTAAPTSGPGAACAPVVTINVMPGGTIIN